MGVSMAHECHVSGKRPLSMGKSLVTMQERSKAVLAIRLRSEDGPVPFETS